MRPPPPSGKIPTLKKWTLSFFLEFKAIYRVISVYQNIFYNWTQNSPNDSFIALLF